MTAADARELVMGAAVEFSSPSLWRETADLLEEERDLGGGTFVAQLANPRHLHVAASRSTLAPSDHPVDTFDGQGAERPDERFARQEPHPRRHRAELIDAGEAGGRAGVSSASSYSQMNSKSRRDTDVLRLLGTYGFLGRVQIEEFVLGESALTAGSREVVTRRILRRLRQRQLINASLRPHNPLGWLYLIAVILI